MSVRLPLLLPAIWIALAGGPFVVAHPVHFSSAEAEWNPESECLEVALRMEPEDLQNALRRRSDSSAGRRVTLESPAAEPLLREYLQQHFVVTAADGKQAKIHWVGFEVTLKEVWVYFEIPLPAGLDGIRISNRMLLEVVDQQVNVVSVRAGDRCGSVELTATAPAKWLALSQR